MKIVAKMTFSLLLAGTTLAGAPDRSSGQSLVRDAAYAESFSYIGGLREMSDGRLMIADPLDKSLILLDLDRGRVQRIGREGGGPQEYRQPDAVYALRGDTTLLIDLGNSRFTIVHPDGSFGETKPLIAGQPGTPTFQLMIPEAVDAEGNVYFQERVRFGPGRGSPELPDSAAILRMTWATGAIDTVAVVKVPERRLQTAGSSNNQRTSISPVPLSPQDDWSVDREGRVALVRSSPYRVEWVDANGRVTRGSTVSVEPKRVRRADQQAWLDEPTLGGMQMGIENNNGVMTTQISRTGETSGQRGQISDYEWPDVLPVFRGGRTRVDNAGNVWVERYASHGEQASLDVFGPDGVLKHSLPMPEGRRIVGFGDGVVYMMYMDEFDLQYLERYRFET